MSKFEYDPRLGIMVPKAKEEFRLSMRMGGAAVEDDKQGIFFIIMKGSDKIGYDRGLDGRGVKRFDYNHARRISEYLKRVQPHSKYTDFRYFYVGTPDPEEKEPDAETPANESARIYEDDWFDLEKGHSTQGESRGMRVHGLKGLVQSVPSAIISAAICWPVALLQLIGSVHIRAEKRWKNTMLNPNVWKDYIQTPHPDKEKDPHNRKLTQKEFDRLTVGEKEKYLGEQFIINNKFYYAMLSNNEVYRVVGARAEDARDMAKAMIGGLKPTYKKLNDKINAGGDSIHTYKVKMDDGEIALQAASDKHEAMDEVRKSREIVNSYYKKQGWIRNQDKDQVEITYLPQPIEVEDLGPNRPIDIPIADDAHIEISTSPIDYFDTRNVNEYLVDKIDWITFQIPAKNNEDLEKILGNVITNADFVNTYEENRNNKSSRSAGNVKCYDVKMQSGDEFKLYIDDSNLPDEVLKTQKTAAKNGKNYDASKDAARIIALKLEKIINSNVSDFYKGSRKARASVGSRAGVVEHVSEITGNGEPKTVDLPKTTEAVLVNTNTDEIISKKPISIKLAA